MISKLGIAFVLGLRKIIAVNEQPQSYVKATAFFVEKTDEQRGFMRCTGHYHVQSLFKEEPKEENNATRYSQIAGRVRDGVFGSHVSHVKLLVPLSLLGSIDKKCTNKREKVNNQHQHRSVHW